MTPNNLPIRLILGFLFLNLIGCQDRSESESVMKILPGELDFGKIKQGEIYKGEFIIYNVGKSRLQIHNIITGCGCTVVRYEKRLVDSNDSVTVSFEIDSKNKFGKQNRTISIFANTKEAVSFFTIKGDIVPK
jgi:Protein of unknown function (DUF1573)